MNENTHNQEYIEEIDRIHKNKDIGYKEKISSLYSVFKTILSHALESEELYFSNDFAKLIYLADKSKFPDELTADLRLLRYIGRKVVSLDKRYDKKNYGFMLSAIFRLIDLLYQIKPNREIEKYIVTILAPSFGKAKKEDHERIQFVNAVVKSKGKEISEDGSGSSAEIFCSSDEIGDFKLIVNGIWLDIYKMIWQKATLNIFDIKKISKDDPIFATTKNSIIVLEPDYLIDATDLADCFMNKGVNVYLYFLKRYQRSKPNLPMLAGNIINTCFDELLDDPDADFETIYYKALKIKPLQLFAVVKEDQKNARYLKERVLQQYITLKEVIKKYDEGIKSAEPSFISPVYGLQGRLDLLIEYEDEVNKKDIVELKSGSAPTPDFSVRTTTGDIIKTGLWYNHLMQTTCYNLLLDSTFNDRTGSSHILYSKTDIYPLRNAQNLINIKQEAILYRNWIISLEMALIKGHYSLLGSLNLNDFGERPPYLDAQIRDFAINYQNASELEKQYFQQYTTFISREIFASKCGFDTGKEGNGYSALWKSTLIEKEMAYLIIPRLKLLSESSDFENMHLTFELCGNGSSVSAFRKGDLGILYPYIEKQDYEVYKQQIIKCHIKEINSKTIELSIRNKVFRKDTLFESEYFSLEQDYIDSTGKALYGSLYTFFNSSKSKRNVMLGLDPPSSLEVEVSYRDDLTDEQNWLLGAALSAKDYFLIQGPPGTGKTSYMLRAIVESIYTQTEETILITAYTNRAVDEICSSLKKSAVDIPFIRLGTKESSVHTENLLYQMALDNDIGELYKLVNNARVIVSTTSSLLSNSEIFFIKDFDTVIVDEASQILEPQIVGILARAERFIMIGDEKQMPAVVLQRNNFDSTKFPELQKIGLNDLSGSLFERLLSNCVKNGWDNCYGMLSYQARMDEPIQMLANDLFYQGKLRRLKLQVIAEKEEKYGEPNVLKDNSLILIGSSRENTFKTNIAEAEAAAIIAKKYHKIYGETFNENTVGIISPYRAQCSLIKSKIDDDLSELISIDTVERYQGSERDVIIISFATNERMHLRNIESITEINGELLDRKLNVAITRARKHLVVIGCTEILKYSQIYSKMLDLFKEKGIVLDIETLADL
jgi:DNA replication ATP-dependent helicase Dna2